MVLYSNFSLFTVYEAASVPTTKVKEKIKRLPTRADNEQDADKTGSSFQYAARD